MNVPFSPWQLTFRGMSRAASVICGMLAFVWILVPHILLSIWQVESSVSTILAGRRSGALFFGLGVMLWLAQDATSSPTRDAIAAGFAASCAVLAALGIYEFVAGHAGVGIWLAVAVEIPLAVGFAFVRRNGR